MNKRQEILNVANELIANNGSTTTLEIKNALRNEYPQEYWTQHYVSNTMREEFNANNLPGVTFVDNGRNRVYQKSVATTPNQYSYTIVREENGVTVRSEITGRNVDDIISTAATAGVYLRWSNTKNELVNMDDMHPAHIVNALRKEIAATSGVEDFLNVLEGPLMETLLEKLDTED